MKKDQTVFIEYGTTEKGQHFMTVMQNGNGQRKIIARVFREYDQENKKTKYIAKDHQGNQIFADIPDLMGLKKKFVENGKQMAYAIPDNPNHQHLKDKDQPDTEFPEREKELKQVRTKNSDKDKGQEISR